MPEYIISRMQPSILELPSQHSKTITMVDTGLKTTTRENSFPRLITGIFQVGNKRKFKRIDLDRWIQRCSVQAAKKATFYPAE